MIQRIQTVLLAIVALCMGAVSSLTIWTKNSTINTAESASLDALSLTQVSGSGSASSATFYILIVAIIAGLLAIFSITQFKNRKLQMLLGAINSMVIAIMMGLIFFFIFTKGMPAFEPNINGKFGFGFYTGGIGLLANMIANRFIRRDENLVRSADRMR
jgi:glucan phosphoethanolaminetransferase (alkaline phosphatase superfamily)